MGVKYSNMQDGVRRVGKNGGFVYEATITVTTTKGLFFKKTTVKNCRVFKPVYSVFWFFMEDGEQVYYDKIVPLERVYFHNQGW